MLRIGISFVAAVAVLANICLAGEPEKGQVILFGKQKRPEFKSTIQAMKYFRKDTRLTLKELSDPRLSNGFSSVDKDGAILLCWSTTAYLAKQVPIHDVKDLMILMAYVNEKDLQLRGIAILALDRSLAVFPNKTFPTAAVTDVKSKQHVQMVERFAQKIAERARGR